MSILKHIITVVATLVIIVTAGLVFDHSETATPAIGQSSMELVNHLGLTREPVTSDFLYSAYVRSVPVETLSSTLSRNAAWMCALSLGLLFLLIVGVLHDFLSETNHDERLREILPFVGSLFSVLYLASCTPFRVLATEPRSASIDILLILSAGLLLRWVWQSPVLWRMLVLCLYLGVAVLEAAHVLVFLPLIALCLVYLVSNKESGSRVWSLVFCGLIFLVPYTIYIYALTDYIRSSDDGLMLGSATYASTMMGVAKVPIAVVVRSLGGGGWILGLLFPSLVWMSVLVTSRRTLDDYVTPAVLLMNTIFSGLVAVILLEIALAPWSVMGARNMMILPYVLMATAFGYLVCYWLLIPFNLSSSGLRLHLSRVISILVLIGSIVLIGCSYSGNKVRVSVPARKLVQVCSEEVVRGLTERDWLVTTGVLDPHILLAAHRRGQSIQLINMSRTSQSLYMKRLATALPSPQLGSLASSGLGPVLQEWRGLGREMFGMLASQEETAFLRYDDNAPIPQYGVYVSLAESDWPEAKALVSAHEQFWKSAESTLVELEDQGRLSEAYANYCRRAISKNMNDVGVFCEDEGQPELSFPLYERAFGMYSNNFSAVVNLQRQFKAETTSPLKERCTEAYERLSKSLRLSIGQVHLQFGLIRDANAIGVDTLAALGGRESRLAQIYRARSLAEGRNKDMLDMVLARSFLDVRDTQKSAELYEGMLEADPGNASAWLGMSRVRVLERDFARAAAYLEKAATLGASPELLDVGRARLRYLNGNPEEARDMLVAIVEKYPSNSDAWGLLFDVLRKTKETQLTTRYRRVFDRANVAAGVKALIEGRQYLHDGDFSNARRQLELAAKSAPNPYRAVEVLLLLDMFESNLHQARNHAVVMMEVDTGHALANLVLASVHLSEKKFDLAKSCLERSVARSPTVISLHDLAWLAERSGDYASAEAYVERAEKLAPGHYLIRDRLASIRIEQKRFAEAEQLLLKIREEVPEYIPALLNNARLYLLTDRPSDAREEIGLTEVQLSKLSVFERDQLEEIEEGLGVK